MTKREQQRRSNTRNRKTSPAARLKFYVLIGIAVVIVCTGFFVAAGQHFWSMDYGIKNSRLRKQLDDLETEKRRLLLSREVSVSPGQVKQAAKRLGITGLNGEAPQLASLVKTSPNSASATASIKDPVKTESQYPVVNAAFTASMSKIAKSVTTKKEEAPRPRVVTTAMVSAR
ncbi:MAG: cbb3-type cytochrome oxidase assembly protein [Chloracidobacterium sp.]|nr:cbb3-type cytochrome oxidase assembly protein [Chloracidobacterium sp.]